MRLDGNQKKPKILEKKIECYQCERIEIARIEKVTIIYEKKPVQVYRWKARGFRPVGKQTWLCNACSKKRCRVCTILLTNRDRIEKLRAKGGLHVTYYKTHPKYCKGCWDEIRKKERNAQKKNVKN